MQLHTEGIVLRQTSATDAIRMLSLFTKKYGKISVGTKMGFGGKKKSALAIRPFTLGDYQIFKNRGYYNLDTAEAVRSYYALGEDIDKYISASKVLELTDKLLQEEVPVPDIFSLLKQFMEILETRKKAPETLVLAYEIKLLKRLGHLPMMNSCVICGNKEGLNSFSVEEGGSVCDDCREKATNSLLYATKFGMIKVVKYFEKTPFRQFEKIALNSQEAEELQDILREYIAFHLDIDYLVSDNISQSLIEVEE